MKQILSPHGEQLRDSVARAQEAMENAYLKYQHALAIALDTGVNSDGLEAVRRECREYGQAVTQHSAALMAWLMFVDTRARHSLNQQKAGGGQ